MWFSGHQNMYLKLYCKYYLKLSVLTSLLNFCALLLSAEVGNDQLYILANPECLTYTIVYRDCYWQVPGNCQKGIFLPCIPTPTASFPCHTMAVLHLKLAERQPNLIEVQIFRMSVAKNVNIDDLHLGSRFVLRYIYKPTFRNFFLWNNAGNGRQISF